MDIINRFKDIKKIFCEINVKDITDNYYIDKPGIKKYCTILLTDNDDHSKIFISEKNKYYIEHDDDDDNESVYLKILNDFNHIEESDRSDIVNLINNDNHKHNITLLVDDYRIFICENDRY